MSTGFFYWRENPDAFYREFKLEPQVANVAWGSLF
jgi:hypothetical protein